MCGVYANIWRCNVSNSLLLYYYLLSFVLLFDNEMDWSCICECRCVTDWVSSFFYWHEIQKTNWNKQKTNVIIAMKNVTEYMTPTCDCNIVTNITFIILNYYVRHSKMSVKAHFQIFDRLTVFHQGQNSLWPGAGVWDVGSGKDLLFKECVFAKVYLCYYIVLKNNPKKSNLFRLNFCIGIFSVSAILRFINWS